ncbi:MAG: glutathione peroxidase [Chitinophagaceae bacterium]
MIVSLISTLALFVSTIYNIHFSDIDGTDRSFNSFEHKKILIVNIASNSNRVDQIEGLQTLYNLYHDSLVIVAIPSNSFGSEPKSNIEIKQLCIQQYNCSFIIAEKQSVVGDSSSSIYKWLGQVSENGVADVNIAGDFEKILIDGQGSIIGLFAPEIEPTSSMIKNAIEDK